MSTHSKKLAQTLHFPNANMSKLCPHATVHYIKMLHFAIQTCQNCGLHFFLSSVHYIKHYTFPIQTCQNCVHKQNVHYIKHYTLLHFSFTNCPLYQMTTLLLHKHVKIASIPKCPLYKSLHFCTQNCKNVHYIKNNHLLHFCYYKIHFFTFLMKVYVKSTNLRTSY